MTTSSTDGYSRQLQEDEGVLIRHTRRQGESLTGADMTAAGAMVMQMWLTGETHHDMIARERRSCSKIYKIAPEGLVYPEYWVASELRRYWNAGASPPRKGLSHREPHEYD